MERSKTDTGSSVSAESHQDSPRSQRRLSNCERGQRGACCKITGDHAFRLRMLEMGMTRGAVIKLVKRAPLNDPIECQVKGYCLAIRRDQASNIVIDAPPEEK